MYETWCEVRDRAEARVAQNTQKVKNQSKRVKDNKKPLLKAGDGDPSAFTMLVTDGSNMFTFYLSNVVVGFNPVFLSATNPIAVDTLSGMTVFPSILS